MDEGVEELSGPGSEDDELALGDGVSHCFVEKAQVSFQLEGDVVVAVGAVAHPVPSGDDDSAERSVPLPVRLQK